MKYTILTFAALFGFISLSNGIHAASSNGALKKGQENPCDKVSNYEVCIKKGCKWYDGSTWPCRPEKKSGKGHKGK